MNRTVAQINAHIAQVQASLSDSQEHGDIVRLERRLRELQAEREAAKQRSWRR